MYAGCGRTYAGANFFSLDALKFFIVEIQAFVLKNKFLARVLIAGTSRCQVCQVGLAE